MPVIKDNWSLASEKPSGSTKAESDSCLTCIRQGRACRGTHLIWIKDEYRCENCGTPGTGNSTRKCYWRDAANNINTWQDAADAAGRRPYDGWKKSATEAPRRDGEEDVAYDVAVRTGFGYLVSAVAAGRSEEELSAEEREVVFSAARGVFVDLRQQAYWDEEVAEGIRKMLNEELAQAGLREVPETNIDPSLG